MLGLKSVESEGFLFWAGDEFKFRPARRAFCQHPSVRGFWTFTSWHYNLRIRTDYPKWISSRYAGNSVSLIFSKLVWVVRLIGDERECVWQWVFFSILYILKLGNHLRNAYIYRGWGLGTIRSLATNAEFCFSVFCVFCFDVSC